MQRRKQKRNSTAKDLISPLPDQIIHDEIFDRLSAKEAARTAVLSKRWNQLWRSYPTIEFHHNYNDSGETAARNIAAALENMSQQPHIRSVMIDLSRLSNLSKPFRAFLDRVMEYSVNNSPLEIDINSSSSGPQYCVPRDIFLYRGLKVLRLRDCYFRNHDSLTGSGRSVVKELCLRNVQFEDDRILNRTVEGASLLENLTLYDVKRMGRFRVANHPSLKVVTVQHCKLAGFEIAGAHSLQDLSLVYLETRDLRVSSTPNLKVLGLQDISVVTDEMLKELISRLPFLEKLVFNCRGSDVRPLKIVHSDKLREIEINTSSDYPNQSSTIEIDAPRLTNLVYRDNYPNIYRMNRHDFPTVLCKTSNCNETTTPVSFWFQLKGYFSFSGLKQFIAEQSQFRLTLDCTDFGPKKLSSKQVPRKQPIPTVECLKFKSSFLSGNRDFINIMFWICHPKSLSVEVEQQHPSNHSLFGLEFLCEQLTKKESYYGCAKPCRKWRHPQNNVKKATTHNRRGVTLLSWDHLISKKKDSTDRCIAPCNCWQLHLKDVKIATNGGGAKGDQLVDVSSDIVSSLVDRKAEEIRFFLKWK